MGKRHLHRLRVRRRIVVGLQRLHVESVGHRGSLLLQRAVVGRGVVVLVALGLCATSEPLSVSGLLYVRYLREQPPIAIADCDGLGSADSRGETAARA